MVSPQVRRAAVKWLVQSALGLVGYGLLLFLPAGRPDWAWGWVLLGIVAGVLAGQLLLMVVINPGLLLERGKGLVDRGVKKWDRWVVGLAAVFLIASWVVAGLDVRFVLTGLLPLAYHLAGLLLTVLGYALFLWALACNAFFAEGVRVQEERGHAVARGGPYRYVRHPGYVGAILSQVATPLLLGSLWALVPAIAGGAMYIVRTHLEDRALRKELPGYEEYAQQTRYRLVPGVW
jgi:protein-S-isoprenylcysteine O-methyltransferase Ste14